MHEGNTRPATGHNSANKHHSRAHKNLNTFGVQHAPTTTTHGNRRSACCHLYKGKGMETERLPAGSANTTTQSLPVTQHPPVGQTPVR